MSTQTLRFPRMVEESPRSTALLRVLTTNTRLLWPGGEIRVALVPCGPGLAAALRHAQSAGRVVRNLQNARHQLAAEQRGLRVADLRNEEPRGVRVSRLLILADDGGERFYRQVETLVRRHGPRVLAVRLQMDAGALGGMLFGPGQLARLLLIQHKDSVCAVLLAMAAQEEPPDAAA